MLAVSNTSPISNLASIGRLELLRSQFSAVRIPKAVAEELMAHPDPASHAAIQSAIRDQWLQVSTTLDSGLLRLLLLQLHPGEAEAIALATDLKDVASLVAAGTPLDELRVIYPKLTPSQIELASIYARANPQGKRPEHRHLPKSRSV